MAINKSKTSAEIPLAIKFMEILETVKRNYLERGTLGPEGAAAMAEHRAKEITVFNYREIEHALLNKDEASVQWVSNNGGSELVALVQKKIKIADAAGMDLAEAMSRLEAYKTSGNPEFDSVPREIDKVASDMIYDSLQNVAEIADKAGEPSGSIKGVLRNKAMFR